MSACCLPRLTVFSSFLNIERKGLRSDTALQIHFTQPAGITGHIMLMLMFVIYTTSLPHFRKHNWALFQFSHYLYLPLIFALLTHATGCFVRDTASPFSPFAGKVFWDHCVGYQSWRWILPCFVLYAVDKIIRVCRSWKDVDLESVTSLTSSDQKAKYIILVMRVPRVIPTGTYVYITVPKISAEAHAFTVTCSGHDPTSVTLMILETGDWTRELQRAFLREQVPQEAIADPARARETVCMREANVSMMTDPSGHAVALGNRHTKVFVDGPYFAPAMHILRCETAIIITTGSGISPGSAVLSSAQYEAPLPDWRLKRLYFIYVAASETLYFNSLYEKDQRRNESNVDLFVHAFISKAKKETQTNIDDLLTWKTGRPDWRSLVHERVFKWRPSIVGPINVDVFFCARASIRKECEKALRGLESEHGKAIGLKFRFRAEDFGG